MLCVMCFPLQKEDAKLAHIHFHFIISKAQLAEEPKTIQKEKKEKMKQCGHFFDFFYRLISFCPSFPS